MSEENKNDTVKVFEDEKKILLDHNYDGIRELDHPLPSWWVGTFILTILFAVPYYVAHTFLGAESIQEELASEMKDVQAVKDEFARKQGGFNEEEYKAIAADPNTDKVGSKTYKRKCMACHGMNGEGGVGPNLTDNYWINGDGSVAAIYDSISHGIPEKGMPAWGEVLGKEKVMAVLKYVTEFKGTNPEGAKAPQGAEYK